MDEDGIYAQVLFPNLAMFAGAGFMSADDRQLQNAIISAYNDYQAEWAETAGGRLLPMTSLPFWDLEASLREFERCADTYGFKGTVMTQNPAAFGLPRLSDSHWDPLWTAFQERKVPVNFHIGTGNTDIDTNAAPSEMGRHAEFAAQAIPIVGGNIATIAELIYGGVCHRFPDLNFVAVESGVGYLPAILELMDWQYRSSGVHKEHPEYELLPTEYFLRQIYGCFWFERAALVKAVEQLGANNFLFETDFPHPTSQTPGPASPATTPSQYVEEALADLEVEDVHKLLHRNAERIYGIAP